MAEILGPRAYTFCDPGATPVPELVCVVFADMIGSTQFWSDVLKGDRRGDAQTVAKLTNAWEFVSSLQSEILKAMLKSELNGTFVKGMGDELIFQFPNPDFALKAAEQAKARLDELAKAAAPNADFKARDFGFRFVIHWTRDPVIFGGYDLSVSSLKAVVEAPSAENAAICPPQSPDLFGHHMNYAARCMSVVAESAIYLTRDAQKKLSSTRDIEDDLEWPIVVGGAKGLGESVKIQQLRRGQTTDFQPPEATVKAYKTKALVYVSSADVQGAVSKYNDASKLMDDQMQAPSPSAKNLVPHLFLAFYTQEFLGRHPVPSDTNNSQENTDWIDSAKYRNPASQLILRIESLDSVYLELLLLDTAAQAIFNAGGTRDTEVDVNTETRFIRTASTEKPDPWKWANRGTNLDAEFHYLEMQPSDVKDIDLYARRIIYGGSSCSATDRQRPQVIEVGRLWGKPSIYAIVKWENPVSCNRAFKLIVELMSRPIQDEERGSGSGGEFWIWKGGRGKGMPKKWNWEIEERQ